jgi:hypothetical protein
MNFQALVTTSTRETQHPILNIEYCELPDADRYGPTALAS